jgi:hypothetical protein
MTSAASSNDCARDGGGRQRQRQRTSPVFLYIFEATRATNDGSRPQPVWMCSLCQPPNISPKWETDNTSNFWNHIKSHHRAIYDQIRPARETRDESTHAHLNHATFTKADQARATNALVHLIVKHAHPYAIVEQHAFREYSKALQPAYKVPCRQVISDKIEQSWENQKDAVRQVLRWDLRDGRRSSLTTDLWTSSANRGYMVVTLHYIDGNWCMRSLIIAFVRVVYPHGGDRLASNLLTAVHEMDPQVVTSLWTITADNATNNGTMVDTLCDDLMDPLQGSTDKRIKYIRCFAHVLQLAVTAGIKHCGDMNQALGGLREVAKKMSDSPKLFEKYQEVCKSLTPSVTAKAFPLDVPTRWNSTYEMIAVLLESRVQLELLLHRIRYGHAGYRDLTIDVEATIRLTQDVWDYAETFLAFLGPIADATKMISGSEYPTLGSVVAILKMVSFHVDKSVRNATAKLHVLTAQQDETAATDNRQASAPTSAEGDATVLRAQRASVISAAKRAVAFFTAVQTKLAKHRANVLCPEAKIAGGLDPRFKTFADEETQQLIVATFHSTFKRRFEAEQQGQAPGMTSPPSKYPKLMELMNEMSGTGRRRRARKSIEEEVEDWFGSPSLVLEISSHDVCDWFAMNKVGFPRIAFMAREYLAIPATSVPSEVAFSKAGSAVEDRRSRLLDGSVREIMELQSYLAFLDPIERKRRVLVYADTEYFG